MSPQRLDQSFEQYEQTRAEDKFLGRVEGVDMVGFRNCVKQLAKILRETTFTPEDIGDMVRCAMQTKEE